MKGEYEYKGYNIVKEGCLWHVVDPSGNVLDYAFTIRECRTKILLIIKNKQR